jgi:hypothetical protein
MLWIELDFELLLELGEALPNVSVDRSSVLRVPEKRTRQLLEARRRHRTKRSKRVGHAFARHGEVVYDIGRPKAVARELARPCSQLNNVDERVDAMFLSDRREIIARRPIGDDRELGPASRPVPRPNMSISLLLSSFACS